MTTAVDTEQTPMDLPAVFRMPLSFQFAEAKEKKEGTYPFTLFARSAEGVPHWYYGQIYHDFSGMKHKGTIPVDWCHDDDEIIGVSSEIVVKPDGLYISGELLQFEQDDRVAKIKRLSDAGVPFEASIDFRGHATYEQVYERRVAQVNGRQIEGPALIVREWSLRAVAICPHGVDPHTSSQFSQEAAGPVAVRIFSEGEPMTNATMSGAAAGNTPAPSQQQAENPAPQTAPASVKATDTTEPPAQQQTATKKDEESDPSAKWKAELKRFTDKFGAEKGTEWYTSGKTWSEACELWGDLLAKQLAASKEENQQLTNKLKGLHSGEDVPAQQGQDQSKPTPDGEGTQNNQFAYAGKLGTFAASLQLPR